MDTQGAKLRVIRNLERSSIIGRMDDEKLDILKATER